MKMAMGQNGYTLVELMLTLAIINVLAYVSVVKVSGAISQAKDAMTRGNLAILRETIGVYYANTEGHYPSFPAPYGQSAGYGTVLSDALVPNYIQSIPSTTESGGNHAPCNLVFDVWNQTGSEDYEAQGYGGGWKYDANPFDIGVYPGFPEFGSIKVLCTHKDYKGINWSNY